MGNHRLELAGKRFGRLLVISDSGMAGEDGRSLWNCRCDCGTETLLPGSRLKRGHVQSCGCLARWKRDLTGRRFYRWMVIGRGPTKEGKALYNCRCDCGTEKLVHATSLLRGFCQSCGCWRVEVAQENGRKTKGGPGNGGAVRRHGESKPRTSEYRAWSSMHDRCNDKTRADYGGRGITVCDRWNSYENFLADVGRRPSPKHSLDRIDNDGNYEPGNCRWATKKEQIDNRRKFGRIEKFSDEELMREVTRRALFDKKE